MAMSSRDKIGVLVLIGLFALLLLLLLFTAEEPTGSGTFFNN